eukprot:58854-Chlamydomonas_euryale.AAC.2
MVVVAQEALLWFLSPRPGDSARIAACRRLLRPPVVIAARRAFPRAAQQPRAAWLSGGSVKGVVGL